MQLSQIPTLVPLPFAANGTKNTIPEASQIGITAGAASLNDGFPPLTFTPLAAGGVPPSGADFNGILNLLSANTQWANAGGFYEFNSSFASAIGGYPKMALLAKSSGQGYWLNLQDNNSNDPDTGGAGWIAFDPWAVQAGGYITAKDTGTANAYAVALSPAPSALAPGMLVNIQNVANTNTGAATLAVNGLSTLPILLGKGTALSGGELTAGYGALVRINNAGSAWELIWTGAGEFVPPAKQNNAAAQLGQVANVQPYNFNTSETSPAASTTYTSATASFTAPSNGYVLAWSSLQNGSNVEMNSGNIFINGNSFPGANGWGGNIAFGILEVSAGTNVSVYSTAVTGATAPGSFNFYTGYLFIPIP